MILCPDAQMFIKMIIVINEFWWINPLAPVEQTMGVALVVPQGVAGINRSINQ